MPFAKAYSGLSDEEIREVDAFVRRNTIEKFGPVHAVKPELVFELAFEGIQRSAAAPVRHCRPLPPHGALASRQARRRGGHHRNHSRPVGLTYCTALRATSRPGWKRQPTRNTRSMYRSPYGANFFRKWLRWTSSVRVRISVLYPHTF